MQLGKSRRTDKLWGILFIIPTVLIFLGLYLWPLLLAFVSSFTQWNGFSAMRFIGLENYRTLLMDANFGAATWNTMKNALLGIAVKVPVGVILALILSHKPRGWRFVRSVYMLPNIISGSGMALMFILIYRPKSGVISSLLNLLGLPGANTNWLGTTSTAFMAVANIWMWYAATVTIIVLSDLLAISPEIYESAYIDGANEFQIDWHINLPLIKRSIGTCMILMITQAFKSFDLIYMTTKGGPGNATLNLAVMMVNSITNQTKYGFSNAIAMTLTLMGIVVMLINTKIFRMDRAD